VFPSFFEGNWLIPCLSNQLTHLHALDSGASNSFLISKGPRIYFGNAPHRASRARTGPPPPRPVHAHANEYGNKKEMRAIVAHIRLICLSGDFFCQAPRWIRLDDADTLGCQTVFFLLMIFPTRSLVRDARAQGPVGGRVQIPVRRNVMGAPHLRGSFFYFKKGDFIT
jgi:hypothetical protein